MPVNRQEIKTIRYHGKTFVLTAGLGQYYERSRIETLYSCCQVRAQIARSPTLSLPMTSVLLERTCFLPTVSMLAAAPSRERLHGRGHAGWCVRRKRFSQGFKLRLRPSIVPFRI